MAETDSEDASTNLKVRPLCKPDVHLKKSRRRIFNENSINLIYSFGYQSSFGCNLCVLKEYIVVIVAGNYLNFLNVDTMTQTFLPSVYGSGFTCVSVHSSKIFFAAAEKGHKFCIHIFKYPALEVYKELKGESSIMPTAMMQFHSQGDLLVSLSSYPENKISVWQWEFQSLIFISGDSALTIYSLHFSDNDKDEFITSGKGHVTFWSVRSTTDERGIITAVVVTQDEELFIESPKLDVYCTVSIVDTFVSTTSEGNLLLWYPESKQFNETIKITMPEKKPCHEGCIYYIIIFKKFIVTLGSDGCMKFWNYETIFNTLNAVANEDSMSEEESVHALEPSNSEETVIKLVCLNPEGAFLISETSELVYGVIRKMNKDYTSFLIQDKNGVLYEVVISADFTNEIITKLLSGLGCNIVGLSFCSLYPFVAAASSLGTVAIYDCVTKEVFKSHTFSVPVTSVIWPSAELDIFASSLLVGFLDGTLRWISFAKDVKNFILKFVIKPHTKAIEFLKMNDGCTVLISQGSDSKLFFYAVEKFSLLPLGFYFNYHEVIDFTWLKYTPENPIETLLILCKYSYVIETEIPNPEKLCDSAELRKTYNIENKNCQVYKISGLRKYHKLGDRIYDSDCEELPELNEAEKEVLRKLKYQEKKERRENHHLKLGLSGPITSPEILSYLPSIYSNHVWLSLGREDFGYIFEFEFQQQFTDRPLELIPIRALEILTAEIIPVLTMQYSPCGHFLYMGLQDGSLNICLLEHAFMPDSGYDFAKYQIHDPDLGQIEHVKISSDGSLITTGGCDGNILLFFFNMPEYKDFQVYEEKPELIDVTEVEDFYGEKLSIEDHLQFEMKTKYCQIIEGIKPTVEKLKNEYQMLSSEKLMEYLNLCKSSLKKLENMPEELELNSKKFSTSSLAIESFKKTTSKLIKSLGIQFEKDITKSTLLHEKYYKFYKAQIDSEKILLKGNHDQCSLFTFRGCECPSNIGDQYLGSYPRMYKCKEKTIIEERRKSENKIEQKIKLNHELSLAVKALIEYPSDTPVSELISKYNQRKEDHIKMLKEHITEYEAMEYIVLDDRKYNEAAQEIEASQFKFKDTYSFKECTSEYMYTYAEKKAKTALYYRKIYDFWKYFNSLIHIALECQTQNDRKNVSDRKVNFGTVEEPSSEIEWLRPVDYTKICVIDLKIKDKSILKIRSEKLIQQQNLINSFITVLIAAKPKVNCEKKFYDIRFILKCIELNMFKNDLMLEKKWLKVVNELECMLNVEKLELSVLEEEMQVLKNKRQFEKSEWMNIYNQLRKVIGLKHKHKGYFKQVFRKKIRPGEEKEPFKRHSSSESSESEQDIDSEDDSSNINPSDVDQNLLKKVMLFRLKRHEVECRMKKYKRRIKSDVTRQLVLQRRIQKISDALGEAWTELNFIPSKRKLEWESMSWPAVLYPENAHTDFFGKKITSIEDQKMLTHKEMSNIYENIAKELKPIYKLITVALIIATDRVVKAELQDLIDVAYVFFSLLDTVAEEVDAYFENLACHDSSKDVQDKIDLKERPVNIIQEILSAAAQETEKLKIKLKAKKKLDASFVPSKAKVDNFEENEYSIVGNDSFVDLSQIDKKRKTGYVISSEKGALKSWRDVCENLMSPKASQTVFDIKNFISRKKPTLDDSLLVDDVYSTHDDYYMLPFCPDKITEHQQKIPEQPEITFAEFSEMFSDLEVAEVMENMAITVTEGEQSDKDLKQSINENFPVYPGGGLVLTRDVLLSMEKEDAASFPYSSFYQEILYTEEELEKPKLIHIVPCYKETELQFDLTPISFEDFSLLNINDILDTLKAYNEIKTTTFETENQIRILETKLLKARNKRINVEQELVAVLRERTEEMIRKFSSIVNLDHLQDVMENPHLRIKKYECDKKLDSMEKGLKELKTSEVTALKTLDKFGFEDTQICYKLLELRNEFKMLNKKYSSQLRKSW